MNNEERQRLKTNEFGQAVQGVGHWLEPYATRIVAVVCAVLLVAAFFTWWSRQNNTKAVGAWSLLERAKSENDFAMVAETYKGTTAGRWGKLRESEVQLHTGMATTFTDREAGLLDLKRAREGFESLLADKSIDPMIRERSLYGLALALETTTDGDTTKAVDAYKQLLNDFPDSMYKTVAEQRIAALKTGGAKEFYAWFSKQNPKPADVRPQDGIIKEEPNVVPPSPDGFIPNLPKTNDKNDDVPPSPGNDKPATEDSSDTPNPKPDDAPKKDEAPGEKPAPEKSEAPKKD